MGMILRWSVKNLAQEAGSLCASAGGIALALLLVLLVDGMFAGESERIVAYPSNAGADVWVMQRGVSNMHMTTSLVAANLDEALRRVSGVASVNPILYVNAFVETGGRSWFSYVVGLPADSATGGPWTTAAGRQHPGRGEVVIPDVVARGSRTDLGDTVTVLGRRLTVVGISTGTYSMANSVTFVSYADLQELLSAPAAASYFLVKAAPGESASELAARIRASVPEVNALSRDTFVANDRRMAMQMGVEIIQLMFWIGSFVAMLIVAFTAYAATARRSRELGIAKALGLRNRRLYVAILVETLFVSILGWVIAVGFAHGLRPFIEAQVPEIALLYPLSTAQHLGLATIAIALVGALAPARRIAQVDPGSVFRG